MLHTQETARPNTAAVAITCELLLVVMTRQEHLLSVLGMFGNTLLQAADAPGPSQPKSSKCPGF